MDGGAQRKSTGELLRKKPDSDTGTLKNLEPPNPNSKKKKNENQDLIRTPKNHFLRVKFQLLVPKKNRF